MDFGNTQTPLVFEIFNERDELVQKSEGRTRVESFNSLEACAFDGRDIYWVTSNIPLSTIVNQWHLTYDDITALYSDFPSMYSQSSWFKQNDVLKRAFEKTSATRRPSTSRDISIYSNVENRSRGIEKAKSNNIPTRRQVSII